MRPSYYLDLVPEAFRKGFGDWVRENIPIWRHVVGQALRAIHLGKTRGAVNLIIEHARWETYLSSMTPVDPFKMPDQWTSSLARLFALCYPEHAEFFSYRERRDSVLMPLVDVKRLIKEREHEQDSRRSQDAATHGRQEGDSTGAQAGLDLRARREALQATPSD